MTMSIDLDNTTLTKVALRDCIDLSPREHLNG